MSKIVSVRLDDTAARLVDQVSADRQLSRSEWLATVVDRALVGEGRMTSETAIERRETRRSSPQRQSRLARR